MRQLNRLSLAFYWDEKKKKKNLKNFSTVNIRSLYFWIFSGASEEAQQGSEFWTREILVQKCCRSGSVFLSPK